MEDIFVEQLVKRRKDGIYFVKVIIILIAAVILTLSIGALFLAIPMISFLLPILFAGCVYGAYRLISSLNLEYEYVVTNGELDIDCIINRRRRKRVFSGRAKDFEIMARLDSPEFDEIQKEFSGAGGTLTAKSLECSSVPGDTENWFIVANYRSERLIIFFAPNEKVLTSLKRFNPRKIMYRLPPKRPS